MTIVTKLCSGANETMKNPVIGELIATSGGQATCRVKRDALRAARSAAGHRAAAASSVGGLVKIATAGRFLVAALNELRADPDSQDWLVAEVDYLGQGEHGQDDTLTDFRRGVEVFPQPGDSFSLASDADYRVMFAPPDQPHILLGTVYPTTDIKAPILYDNLLGRHFAVVGSSGTGKSTTVSLLLDRIIDKGPHAHVIILDPHGEYAHAFGDRAKVWDVSNLQLPYWAMNLSEHCEAFITSPDEEAVVDRNILATCLQQARARNVRLSDAAKVTADAPIPYQLADLTTALEQEAGKLEKLADASRYVQLRLTVEHHFADPRFGFIFNPDFWNLTLENLLGELLRIPDEGKPVSIIDLAGVPTEIVNVVVSTLSRLVLDYAIQTPRAVRTPMLLLCEEAHRYLPRVQTRETAAVRRQLERIAREGRKYGVCLGLVSQRPSELSETALSQCGTILSLRLNNLEDQRHLIASLSEGARNLVGVIASLGNRECIVSGDGVPVPMRIRIDTVPPDRKPDSEDELFSVKWRQPGPGTESLAETVRTWREGL